MDHIFELFFDIFGNHFIVKDGVMNFCHFSKEYLLIVKNFFKSIAIHLF